MQLYIKYKDYYDKKARATPLKVKDICYILQPKADHQGSKIPFRDFRWIGPYVVEKVVVEKDTIYALTLIPISQKTSDTKKQFKLI